MAIRNIRRQATNPLGAAGTPTVVPIYVDSDDNILKMIPAGSGTTEVEIVDVSSTQSLTNKTITGAQTYTSGNLAVVGSITSSDATTPVLATATGKTNTGYLSLTGKTSGSFKVLPADATAQVVTMAIAAQTVGAATLTIQDQANVSSNFVFDTLAATLTNKTLTSPTINAGALSGTFTGTPTFSGAVVHTGADTHSAAEVFSGNGTSAVKGVLVSKVITLTENGAATSYTGSVVLPAASILHDIYVIPRVLWNGTSATLKVGDTADDDGFFTGVNLKVTDALVGEVLSLGDSENWGGKQGAYLVAATGARGPLTNNFGLSYVTGSTINFIVTPGAADGTLGRTDCVVTFSTPTVIAQVTV